MEPSDEYMEAIRELEAYETLAEQLPPGVDKEQAEYNARLWRRRVTQIAYGYDPAEDFDL